MRPGHATKERAQARRASVGPSDSQSELAGEPVPGPAGARTSVLAHLALLALAVTVAWRPVEIFPWTGALVALGVLLLLPWGWRRQSGAWRHAAIGALLLGWVAVGLLVGWDRARAISELTLLGSAAAVAWLASREAPPRFSSSLLALGLAGLALWGLWQVTAGGAALQSAAVELDGQLGRLAADRLATGRAFASLSLPSHLAVVLATALPLLVGAARRSRIGWAWLGAALVCGGGIVLTRSLAGAGLAVVALAVVVFAGRGRGHAALWAAALVLIFGSVLMLRGDLAEVEFLRLRADNWRTALWVWSTSPVAGVGLGGLGQASQGVPFPVGNLPVHAHCLPLEWAAEMGLPGLLASLALLLWVGRLVSRVARSDLPLATAIAVVPLHNLVDFSLFSSGVVLPWAVLTGWGAATVWRREGAARASGGRIAAVVVAAAALAGVVLHASSSTLERAAVGATRPSERSEVALTAHRLAPWRLPPVYLVGSSALEEGGPGRAAEALEVVRRARWLRPQSAALARLAADLAAAGGDRGAAAERAWATRGPGPVGAGP